MCELYTNVSLCSESRVKEVKFRCCAYYITPEMRGWSWESDGPRSRRMQTQRRTSYTPSYPYASFSRSPRTPEVPFNVNRIVLQKRATPPLWGRANWDGVYINGVWGEREKAPHVNFKGETSSRSGFEYLVMKLISGVKTCSLAARALSLPLFRRRFHSN